MATHNYATTPNPFRATELPYDHAWAPNVAIGHTQYSWFGHVYAHTPDYSYLLGCVVDPNAKKEEKPAAVEQPKKQQAKPEQAKKQPPVAQLDVPEGVEATIEHCSKLNFIVGEITACAKHPGADSLYVEKINLGPTLGEQQIVSGLVKYLTVEQMIGSKVIVVQNFKASALRGEMSNGMVLCASNDDKSSVVLVTPPSSAKPGDRIVPVVANAAFGAPVAEINPKKAGNYWGAVAPQLKTNDKGELCFGNVTLGNADGPATATLSSCRVS